MPPDIPSKTTLNSHPNNQAFIQTYNKFSVLVSEVEVVESLGDLDESEVRIEVSTKCFSENAKDNSQGTNEFENQFSKVSEWSNSQIRK